MGAVGDLMLERKDGLDRVKQGVFGVIGCGGDLKFELTGVFGSCAKGLVVIGVVENLRPEEEKVRCKCAEATMESDRAMGESGAEGVRPLV